MSHCSSAHSLGNLHSPHGLRPGLHPRVMGSSHAHSTDQLHTNLCLFQFQRSTLKIAENKTLLRFPLTFHCGSTMDHNSHGTVLTTWVLVRAAHQGRSRVECISLLSQQACRDCSPSIPSGDSSPKDVRTSPRNASLAPQ